jgi:hypothetical protein
MSLRKTKEILWVYALASVAYGIFALLLLFPIHPISATGWGIWLAVSAPVAMAGETIGTIVFNNRTGLAIDDDVEQVSMTRVAYGIVVAILVMVALLFIASEFDLLADAAWDRHFSRNW